MRGGHGKGAVVASLGAIAGACHVLRSAIADVRDIIHEADGLTTLGRISTLRASGEAEPVDPSDETVSNGAPFTPHQAIRSGVENRTAPVDRSGAHWHRAPIQRPTSGQEEKLGRLALD